VLEELGRADEAEEWERRASIAADALDAAAGVADREVIVVEEIELIDDEGGVDVASGVIPLEEDREDSVESGGDEHVVDVDEGSASVDANADGGDDVSSDEEDAR